MTYMTGFNAFTVLCIISYLNQWFLGRVINKSQQMKSENVSMYHTMKCKLCENRKYTFGI